MRPCLPVPLVAAALALGGCGGEPPPTPDPTALPASWEGVWSVTFTTLDCGSGGVVNESTSEQVLCEGQPLRFDFDDPLLTHLECDGVVTDGSFDLECRQTWTVAPSCDVTLQVSLAGTRDGESFSGTGSLATTNQERAAGACADYLPICFDLQIEGTRLRPSSGECN